MEYLEKLRNLGITVTKSCKTHCPNTLCSDKRNIKNDLSVTFQSDRVVYQCHNEGCGFKGVVFHNFKPNQNKKNYRRPEPPKVNENKERLYNYFKKRGISKETVDKFKVETSDSWQMIFPYTKNGEVVNHKYRKNIGEGKKKFMQDPEAEQVFYGMDLITDFTQLVVVEGELDCLSFAEIGIESVSVPTGGSDTKMDCIENCYEWLEKFETIVIAVDNDTVGNKLKNTLLDRLDKSKCKIASYDLNDANAQGGYKDANDVLMRSGWATDYLKMVISMAEYYPLEDIVTLDDAKEEIIDFYENGLAKGTSTGWANVDKLFNIQTGYLMVITGYPSSGKSFFQKNMLLNLTRQEQWKHLLFDGESNIAVTTANLIKAYAGEEYYRNIPPEQMEAYRQYLNNYFYFLPRAKDWTIDDIINKTREAKKRYGIKSVTIDPYGALKHDIGNMSETLYIQLFLQKCVHAAQELDLLFCIVAHPTKPGKDEKMPTLYSISGSAEWRNKADYGIVAHRERSGNSLSKETQIHAQKIKDFHLGNPSGGKAILTKELGRFVDKESSLSSKISTVSKSYEGD